MLPSAHKEQNFGLCYFFSWMTMKTMLHRIIVKKKQNSWIRRFSFQLPLYIFFGFQFRSHLDYSTPLSVYCNIYIYNHLVLYSCYLTLCKHRLDECRSLGPDTFSHHPRRCGRREGGGVRDGKTQIRDFFLLLLLPACHLGDWKSDSEKISITSTR